MALEILSTHPNAPHAVAALEALETLDNTIHQKARLGIMSTLLALGEADFKLLKETLALSDGNLSTHLALLEERGYVEARKEFIRRKPHTTYTPTEAGREAFQRYLLALERIIQAAQPAETAQDSSEAPPAPADSRKTTGQNRKK
ncbi:MAG TPA: transcriptional regulator [Chthonomonadaceae bacterium]|nr:transcriptional regulator [Chthonomonadaceae bacterium]